jgi:hypothetical protein
MRGQYGVALVLGVLVAAHLAPARSETLRVGKAVRAAFPFVFVDIGVESGIFKKRGLDLEISAWS